MITTNQKIVTAVKWILLPVVLLLLVVEPAYKSTFKKQKYSDVHKECIAVFKDLYLD